MKSIFFGVAALAALLFQSCGAHMYSARSGGQADQAYIIVLSDSGKSKNVTLQIDGAEHPIDKLYKSKDARKAQPIVIPTGRHALKVVVDGKVVREEQIFLGGQQTKKITL